jgi:hypothetical protein
VSAQGGRRLRVRTPPAGSRLGRVVPTLADVRELLLLEHPECRRGRAGIPGMQTIAQVVSDWASPAGQRVVAEYLKATKDPDALNRYLAKRERIAARVERLRGELAERELVARRVELLDQAAALAAAWAAEDERAAVAAASKRSAA